MRKPKTLAYLVLHYGADYVQYAIQSVYPVVDQILILYAEKPSHGTGTGLVCPDTKETLLSLVAEIDTEEKCIWVNGNWTRENDHRNHAHWYAKDKGFDILVSLDSDEIWNTQYLSDLIKEVYEKRAEKCLVWMRHLWRSFDYICDDAMRQERIYYVGPDKTGLIYAPHPVNQVWHFGYARSLADVKYKIGIHGHSNEWILSKEAWFENKYKPFPPVQDVHPTCKDTWNPIPFDKSQLPEFMESHPYYNLKSID